MRVLLVMLIVINACVGVWWALHPVALAPPAPIPPPGVARLELFTPTTMAATATAQDAPAQASGQIPAKATGTGPFASNNAVLAANGTARHCLRLGPFATQGQAQTAATRITGEILRSAIREDTGSGTPNFRVILPAAGDRMAARALLERIAAAGIQDYGLIAQGEQQHTIALGQYRSRESAARRQAELAAAGFPAQVLPGDGRGRTHWWLDLQLAGALAGEIETPQHRFGTSVHWQPLDCATLR